MAEEEIVAKPVEDVEQLSKDIAGGVNTSSVPKTPVTKLRDEIKDKEEDYKLSDEDLKLTIDQEGFDVEDADTPTGVVAPSAKEGLGQIADEDISKTKEDIENLKGKAAKSEGPTEEIDMDDIIKGLSDDATAEAQTENLDEKATVQYQMSELMASIEEGKPPPAWASGAVRKVSAIMQSRGMGSSSMAASAMVQSVMEAGIPIATADAMSYGKIQLQNLANSQATALQNAATVAAMDTAELNARLTGAVANAKNFLSIDLGNLTNEQAINTLDYQAAVKSVFTDAAQENVTNQINAKK
jgi:hypothetical protein